MGSDFSLPPLRILCFQLTHSRHVVKRTAVTFCIPVLRLRHSLFFSSHQGECRCLHKEASCQPWVKLKPQALTATSDNLQATTELQVEKRKRNYKFPPSKLHTDVFLPGLVRRKSINRFKAGVLYTWFPISVQIRLWSRRSTLTLLPGVRTTGYVRSHPSTFAGKVARV